MTERERRVVQYENLNPLGRAVFFGGAAVRGASRLLDLAIERAADIYVDAERAFKQGRDADIDDAKILDEQRDR